MSPLDRDPRDLLEPLLGGPVVLTVLKDKPGRRRTSRAVGPRGSAVVKVYASDRAPVVAARLAALQAGPAEPVVPRLLLCDPARHAVVIGELDGVPLSSALHAGGAHVAARAGAGLAAWHAAHRTTTDPALRVHGVAREAAALQDRAAGADPVLCAAVARELPDLLAPWPATTVVHRDLYEEQVLVGPRLGLVDLDDAGRGPGELDLGNALAHLHLRRLRGAPPGEADALLAGYAAVLAPDPDRLAQCTRLALLRLACLHREPALLTALDAPVPARGAPA